jgi:NAD(P)H-dependent FMN reductase
VSYGSAGGARAVEQFRLVAGELQMADVRAQVLLPFSTEFENHRKFTPSDGAAEALDAMLKQLIAWSGAMERLRKPEQSRRMAG